MWTRKKNTASLKSQKEQDKEKNTTRFKPANCSYILKPREPTYLFLPSLSEKKGINEVSTGVKFCTTDLVQLETRLIARAKTEWIQHRDCTIQMTSTLTAYLTPNAYLSTPTLRYYIPKINNISAEQLPELCCRHCHYLIKSFAATNLLEYVATHSHLTGYLRPCELNNSIQGCSQIHTVRVHSLGIRLHKLRVFSPFNKAVV